MTRKEIELLNNEVITEEQLTEIEEHEEVTAVESCGFSSSNPGAIWYDIQFEDGKSIDVFVK